MLVASVEEAIATFGGTSKTAALFGVLPSAVSNWKKAGRFPARLHYRVSKELEAREKAIDPALFVEGAAA